jgi:hypothetical protein
MTSAHLVACPSCARHVRASESVCPFCATVVPDATRGTEPRRPPTERLSRSALYAFGVGGSLAVAAACGGSTTTGSGGDSGTADSPAHDAPFGFDGVATHYGGFPADAMFFDAGSDDAADVGIAVPYGQPAYGAFPIDATPADDASADDGGNGGHLPDGSIGAAYGGPGV